MRILIAEDDEVLADGLSRSLRAAGYAVDVVGNGRTADSALVAQHFDVRGLVVDSARAPISGAMVVALTRKNSVIAAFATSGGSGGFILRRLTPGDYILQVTRIGLPTATGTTSEPAATC